jgi:xylan 1,4-beta-xylosidase
LFLSDCNAIDNIYANHNYTANNAAAEGIALTAGCDQSCEAGSVTNITGAYYGGYVTEEVIDQALRRQYEALVIAGYFDPASSNPYRAIGWDQVNTPHAQRLARQAATEGMVLLKNDGILPTKFGNSSSSNATKVAMIGMWANGTTQMQGSYYGVAPYLHSPLYAAQQLGLDTIHATGPINESESTGNWTTPALAAAQEADAILYFGGIDETVEAEAMDRYQIAWPESQLSLLSSLSGLGKPVIVVQMGSMLDATPILSSPNISALLWAGYPGQDGGPAVFDILTGAVAPAGRLPVTMYPANYVNEVPMTNMSLRPGTGNPGRTYMWFDEPVLPFGYGLSYTNFGAAFSNGTTSPSGYGSANSRLTEGGSYDIQSLLSSCKVANPDLCPFSSAEINVANKGKTTSDFVALAFLNTTAGPPPYPLKTLASYTRLPSLVAGSTGTASLNITLGTLARRAENGDLVLYPGEYELLLDEPTQAKLGFSLTGQQATLENWPQPPANQTYAATLECPEEGACGDEPVGWRKEKRVEVRAF